MLRIPVPILFCCILLFSYAQDTTKRAQPVKIATKYKTYKQVSKYHTRIRDTSKKINPYSKTYPHHFYRYHARRTDTAKIKPGGRDTAAVKPVTIAPAGPVDKSL